LAYFSPVIEEVLESRVNPNYYQYLRHKIQRFLQTANARSPLAD
jgi:flagellar biosynthesis/type III secretory pathway protein FliH